jgi:hypothetical protein
VIETASSVQESAIIMCTWQLYIQLDSCLLYDSGSKFREPCTLSVDYHLLLGPDCPHIANFDSSPNIPPDCPQLCLAIKLGNYSFLFWTSRRGDPALYC